MLEQSAHAHAQVVEPFRAVQCRPVDSSLLGDLGRCQVEPACGRSGVLVAYIAYGVQP